MKYITSSVLVLFALGLLIPNAFAENVPDWVKNTAGWWATDVISEMEFVNAIEFLPVFVFFYFFSQQNLEQSKQDKSDHDYPNPDRFFTTKVRRDGTIKSM